MALKTSKNIKHVFKTRQLLKLFNTYFLATATTTKTSATASLLEQQQFH